MTGGKYWHNGLEKTLKICFKNVSQDLTILLNINIDGLPLHKSSKHQFWPILCNIYNMSHIPPIIIGIYYGKSKPLSLQEYLMPFTDEIVYLINNGININSHMLNLKVRCFICDSPARAFIKGIYSYHTIPCQACACIPS